MKAEDLKEVKDYLNRPYRLKRRIEAKEAHLDELRTQAEKVTPVLNGMPRGSGPSSNVERIAVMIADLSSEIDENIAELHDATMSVKATIDSLGDDRIAQVMTYRYLAFLSWSEIAKRTHYSMDWLFALNRKAFREIIAKKQQ